MRLDARAVAEIHADAGATYQAVAVVVISSLALAVQVPGGWLTTVIVPLGFIAWWLVGSYVIYWLGTALLSGKDTLPTAFAPLARGIGFAMGPRILQIFLVVEPPFPFGRLIQFLSIGWIFAAMTVSTHIAFGRASYTRVTLVIGLAMLPVILFEPFILG